MRIQKQLIFIIRQEELYENFRKAVLASYNGTRSCT